MAGLAAGTTVLHPIYRPVAHVVVKVLRGASRKTSRSCKPTDFEVVINLTIAKALGPRIPESVLVRADKVIE